MNVLYSFPLPSLSKYNRHVKMAKNHNKTEIGSSNVLREHKCCIIVCPFVKSNLPPLLRVNVTFPLYVA